MSQDHRKIGRLLKSIELGLQTFSVHELNKAIVSTLQKNSESEKILEIDYVLNIVCDEFRLSKKMLMTKTKERGRIQEAKWMAYCLLHHNLEIPIRHIASNVFMCFPNTIVRGIKKLRDADPNLKHEKELLERYNLLRDKLKNNLTLEKPIETEKA
jgi:hypothetical protein